MAYNNKWILGLLKRSIILLAKELSMSMKWEAKWDATLENTSPWSLLWTRITCLSKYPWKIYFEVKCSWKINIFASPPWNFQLPDTPPSRAISRVQYPLPWKIFHRSSTSPERFKNAISQWSLCRKVSQMVTNVLSASLKQLKMYSTILSFKISRIQLQFRRKSF